jgi:hypothetical protein
MKAVGNLYSEQVPTKDGKVLTKQFMKYACPKDCCKLVSTNEPKSGYSNPYAHLSSCYGPEKLLELYEEAILHQTKQGGIIDPHIKAASASEYDKAIYGYMCFIVMKSLPISYIEDRVVELLWKNE